MAESGELDFSNLDGMDDIDWSDVESELQQNREMLRTELEESSEEEPAPETEIVPSNTAPEPADEGGKAYLMGGPLQLKVEVGRTRLKIKDLLHLGVESVKKKKKKVGGSMNVLISDKLVAKGEIVIQNEKFGLKITEILDTAGRLKKLKES